jgi:hypothetical protein
VDREQVVGDPEAIHFDGLSPLAAATLLVCRFLVNLT